MLIEDLGLQRKPERIQPDHAFGRITNKYLIIDIYSLAYHTREEAMYRLFKHHKSSRNVLINLYQKLSELIPHEL